MVLLPRVLRGAVSVWQVDRSIGSMTGADYLLGMLLTAAFPATVWCAALKAAAVLFHFDMTWTALAIVGAMISTFLASVYTCLVRNI